MDQSETVDEDVNNAKCSHGDPSQPKCYEDELGKFKYDYASSSQAIVSNEANSSTAIVIPRRSWEPYTLDNVSVLQASTISIQRPSIFSLLIRNWMSRGIYDMIRSSSLSSKYVSDNPQFRQPPSICLQQNTSYDEVDLLRRSYEQSVLIVHMLNSGVSAGSLSFRVNTSRNGRQLGQGILLLGQSPFFSVDHYEDMRLDVENMSYEELLDLEDRIGDVATGLSQEIIDSYLKKRKYFLLVDTQALKESCLICQEDYVEEDELGSLACGHDFHRGCITQWLRCKNICPVCKSTGLNTSDPSITHNYNTNFASA